MHHARPATLAGFKLAKANGLRFLIHKCTQGLDFVDPKYGLRRGWATTAGLRFGGYHWLETSDPVKQVEHFLQHLKVREGDWRPSLDFEDKDFEEAYRGRRDGPPRAGHRGQLKAEVGVLPQTYTTFDLDDNFGMMLWVPRYNPRNEPPRIPTPWKQARIRQFANGEVGVPHTFPGLGPMDLNHLVLEGPKDSIAWFLVPAKSTPVKPTPAPKPPTSTPAPTPKPTPAPVPKPEPTGKLTCFGTEVLPLGSSDHHAVIYKLQLPSGQRAHTGHANLQGTDKAVEIRSGTSTSSCRTPASGSSTRSPPSSCSSTSTTSRAGASSCPASVSSTARSSGRSTPPRSSSSGARTPGRGSSPAPASS